MEKERVLRPRFELEAAKVPEVARAERDELRPKISHDQRQRPMLGAVFGYPPKH